MRWRIRAKPETFAVWSRGSKRVRAICALTVLGAAIVGRADDCNHNGVDDAIDLVRGTVAVSLVERRDTGLTPRAIVAADFDRDGHIDVATADRHSNGISLLRNTGDGGRFETATTMDVANPAWLTTGDFDDDGEADLAVVSSLSADLSVFRGSEGMTFTATEGVALGSTGWDFVATGDIDGDGVLDLVLVNRFRGDVAVAYGRGDATFALAEPIRFPESTRSRTVAIGDLDADGDQDLAIAAEADRLGDDIEPGSVIVILNEGDRRFAEPVFRRNAQSPRWIIAGDFDGDARTDLAWADEKTPLEPRARLVVSLQRDGGTFEDRVVADGEHGDLQLGFVASADLDVDGTLDLLVLPETDEIWTLVNDGGATFRLAPDHSRRSGGNIARAAAVADFDGDGRPEVAAASYRSDDTDNEVAIFDVIDAPPESDCNENGIPDACDIADPVLSFVETQVVGIAGNARGLVVHDFDDDGTPDVVTALNEERGSPVVFNDGAGSFDRAASASTNLPVCCAADLDDDGALDLVSVDLRGFIYASFGLGEGEFLAARTLHATLRRLVTETAVADIDGDGLPDLIATVNVPDSCSVDTVSILRNSGDRTFESVAELETGRCVLRDVSVEDWDGDGLLDIAVASPSTRNPPQGSLTFFWGLGGLEFEPPQHVELGPHDTSRIASADFDGDGHLDFAFGVTDNDASARGVHVFYGDGDRGFTERGPSIGAVRGPSDVWAVDVNGDGLRDLVELPERDPESWIFENLGSGRFGPGMRIVTHRSPAAVAATDVDGDGLRDLVTANHLAASSLSILRATVAPASTDCDGNGTPDECAIASGELEDCDENGIPDACEPLSDRNENGVHDACEGPSFAYRIEGPERITGPPGSIRREEYTVLIAQFGRMQDRGAQGWSIAVAASGAEIISATTAGTLAADGNDDPPGLRNAGFEQTELASDGGVLGAASAIVLSAIWPITLPPSGGDSPVLRLEVEFAVPAVEISDSGAEASIFFHDGLRGSGQPMSNQVVRDGQTYQPHLGELPIRVSAHTGRFLRGDANADGRVDISDGIATLNFLFLGAAELPCHDAADADDNGAVDISDAISTNTFLFLGGATPPAPGPSSCGEDPTSDELSCANSNACR